MRLSSTHSETMVGGFSSTEVAARQSESDTPIEVSPYWILAVDDEPTMLAVLKRALRKQPYRIEVTTSSVEALERLEVAAEQGDLPALVMSDFKMPGMDGVQFLERVKDKWPEVQRILLTAIVDTHILESAINRSEIHRYLQKPWERGNLISSVRHAIDQFDLVQENKRLVQAMEQKHQELVVLNNSLEEQVEKRTQQVTAAKLAWEFDAISDPVVLIGLDYVVERANRAAAERSYMQVWELPGQKCHRVIAGSDSVCEGCPMAQARRSNQESESLIKLPRRDVIYEVSAFPFNVENDDYAAGSNFVCVYRDVTDRERFQRRLIQSEKMTALGVLSGAVAHEINNPLGGILAFAQIMMREVEREDEKYTFLEQIEESALRCQKTVRNLLDFARFSPTEERHRTTMGNVVEKAVRLVGHRLELNAIRVEIEECHDDAHNAPVVINSNQVQMVIVNLLHNASDAMEHLEDGTICVSFDLDASTSPPVVAVQVQDEGSGIRPEHIAKIFDPFFTTKEEGKGTGLGLALSYQIVQENAGTIEVESKYGVGTTFTMTFPIVHD